MECLENLSFDMKSLEEEIASSQAIHCAFIAGSKSGKNVLLYYILSKISEKYSYIHVMTGSSKTQYQNIAFANRILELDVRSYDQIQRSQRLVDSYINRLVEAIRALETNNKKHLIIFDDLGIQVLSLLKYSLRTIRHYNISIFIITQNVIDINSLTRPNIDYWFTNNYGSIVKITNRSGQLFWAHEMLKTANSYLNLKDAEFTRIGKPLLRRNLWIVLSNTAKKVAILKMPDNFFDNNFVVDQSNTYRYLYTNVHLGHQIKPQKILDKIRKKKDENK